MASPKPGTRKPHLPPVSSQEKIAEILFQKNLPLFENLALPDKQLIQSRSSFKQFEVGTHLLSRQKQGAVVYLLMEGRVKIYLESNEDLCVTLAFRKNGELLGEIGAIDGSLPSASVLVVEPCKALVMPKIDFIRWMQFMPYFGFNVSQVLVNRVRFATQQIYILSTMDSKSRVARQLLTLAQWHDDKETKNQGTLPRNITQQVLAEMVGCSRAQVNRDLMHLIQKGFLGRCQNKKLIVLDRQALEKHCS